MRTAVFGMELNFYASPEGMSQLMFFLFPASLTIEVKHKKDSGS